MPRRIMLVPIGFEVGLTSASFGLYHKLQQLGIDVGYFKPISQPSRNILTNDQNSPAEFSHTDVG